MSTTAMTYDWKTVAAAVDHTILKPEATPDQLVSLCAEAKKYGFAAVCVQPCYVELAAKELAGTDVKVASVVGFPNGATLTSVKAFEAAEAARLGAAEIDMVINVGQLKAGNRQYVEDDIRAVAKASQKNGAILKVIIETCLLSREEKVAACELSVKAGADFVKTSTGFSSAGATAEDVGLMREVVGPTIGVKAAGGIRTAGDAAAMLRAGASRIGASASVAIVRSLGAPE
jgi:deoxyribose-phosphate aldolase